MSKVNRKILYDKLMAEGKLEEAAYTIQNHPEMAIKPEEPKEEKPTKSKDKK